MPWLATTETTLHPHKIAIVRLHKTTVDDPHLEDKGIGSIDNPLHQLSPSKYLEPLPQSNTPLSIKHLHYKKLSKDLQETSCITKLMDLSDFQSDLSCQKTTIWGTHYLHVASLNYDNLETVACTYYSTIQITK